MLKKSERLFRIPLSLRNPYRKNVNRHTELAQLKTGTGVNNRMPPVSADNKIRTNFQLAFRLFLRAC